MEQTNQAFNPLAVIPLTLVLYDYAITLDKEVEYVWTKSTSVVTLIYLTLQYFGTIAMMFYTIILLWNGVNFNEGQL
ncbi:hypothetical protein J3A83DRAFT_4256352 [Scleroderma citrinum]